MKSNDFDPETTELAIRVIHGVTIHSDEVCARCGTRSKICPVESLTIVDLESATA